VVKPKPRKEPYTYHMLASQAKYLLYLLGDQVARFVSHDYAVWDWLRLGIFMGSQLSEYAQSGLQKGQKFQVIPINAETGAWGGKPLAFTRFNFQFFDATVRNIAHSDVFRLCRQGKVCSVHIRF
jgi:hypothetical protein